MALFLFLHPMKSYSLFFLAGFLLLSCRDTSEQTLFQLMDQSSTGIDFQNTLDYTEELNPYTYRNFYNGGGVALGDVNNDGLTDIFFTGNLVSNALYLNTGDWSFDNVTLSAGLQTQDVWSTGAVMVDINHDGWLDIYVCKSGPPGGDQRKNALYINQQDGTFKDQAKAYGLDFETLSVQAAFFDYDKDGDLDCYLLSNSIRSTGGFDLIKDQRNIPDPSGNKLLRNDNGNFVDVSQEAGIYSSSIGFGLGITLEDFNQDHWLDIFISNDFFERDYLYLNQQDGSFKEVGDVYFNALSMGSMGADAADLDNDLLPELFVTEMLPATLKRKKTKAQYESWDKYNLALKKGYHHQFPRNVLQRNLGPAGFVELGRFSGVAATEWSWAALMFDMDNDGWRDIFISNGIYKDLLDRDYLNFMANDEQINAMIATQKEVVKKLIDKMPSSPLSNFAFANKQAFQFESVAKDWGLDQPSYSNGSAYADFDNDGDLDLVVSNVNMPPFVYQNNSSQQGRKGFSVRLKGNQKNTKAVGARVTIKYQDSLQSTAINVSAKGFQSSVQAPLHFGIGNASLIDSLWVEWPNGAITQKSKLNPEIPLVLEEPESSSTKAPKRHNPVKLPIEPTEALFEFTHQENTFIDFNSERLLAEMHSNEGPAVAVADLNADGEADVYLGGARGYSGQLFISSPRGYISHKAPFETDHLSEDTEAVFEDFDGDGDLDLWVASGGKSLAPSSIALQDRLYLNTGAGIFQKSKYTGLVHTQFSTGAVAAADYNRDGYMDIFVGERMKSRFYGYPGKGVLLKGSPSGFESVQVQGWDTLGMITTAVWADVDANGWEDLIVAGRWTPIQLYLNQEGVLTKASESWGLKNTHGLWNALDVADLDGDGDLDVLAANHGTNSFYSNRSELVLGDFDQNGIPEQILCEKVGDSLYPVLDRDILIQQMPGLKKNMVRYQSYAEKTLLSLVDKGPLDRAIYLKLQENRSMIYWNRSNQFVAEPLAPEFQYSCIYDFEITDLNNDGEIDIFAGGNQSKVKPRYGKYDASKGWWLTLENTPEGMVQSTPKALGIDGEIRALKWILTPEGTPYLMSVMNDQKIQWYAMDKNE